MRLYYSESEIVSFVRDGADPAERVQIAAQMNCCQETVILAVLKRHGMYVATGAKKAGRKSTLKPGQLMQIEEAISRGVKCTEIAKLLGVNKGSVTYYAQKMHKEKEKAPK